MVNCRSYEAAKDGLTEMIVSTRKRNIYKSELTPHWRKKRGKLIIRCIFLDISNIKILKLHNIFDEFLKFHIE